jgi:hypothetical protein
VSAEVIKRLNETPDGARTTFTTPDLFAAGSFRLVRNGSVYESDDSRFGWTETDQQTIELTEAPESGEVLQGFYTLLTSCGTPFDPGGTYT